MPRDDFPQQIKNLLALRVGMKCSNPECGQPTAGPQEDPKKYVNVGVAAHITGAAQRGPRYDASLTPEERRAYTNGIWLCQICAKLIDDDKSRYTVDLLQDWKKTAEESARRALESRVGVPVNAAKVGLLADYLEWVARTTATFYVPGLPISLPVADAWISLKSLYKPMENPEPKTLADKISRYHEWERLFRSSEYSEASDIVELENRVVIIGGPGSGKSILCRRSAHQFARCGYNVLLIRLPQIEKRVKLGATIDKAIIEVAADGCGLDLTSLERELVRPDYLLADGLDECLNPVAIAEALIKWCNGHSSTRTTITTRPVGYPSFVFSEWQHAELLPFDKHCVNRQAKVLVHAALKDSTQAEEILCWFEDQLESNKIASLAARSPLFLGFMIRLAIDRLPFGTNRANLYKQIISCLQENCPHREYSVAGVQTAMSIRTLEIVGWELQTAAVEGISISEENLINRLAQAIVNEGDYPLLRANEIAEFYVTFWREHGLLEHLKIGIEDAYTFVHLNIQEYCAARYITSLSAGDRIEWLKRVHRIPRWREVLLLAAGDGAVREVVETLLAMDNLEDPVSTVLILAAAALAESEPIHDLSRDVIKRLTVRLSSRIPLVAYEAAKAAVGLAPQMPELIANVVEPLLHHDQPWTRLAAYRLAISAGPTAISLENLQSFFNLSGPYNNGLSFDSNGEWDCWNSAVSEGAKILFDIKPDQESAELLDRLTEKNVSMNTVIRICEVLRNTGYSDVATRIDARPFLKNKHVFGVFKDWRLADIAFLDAISRICGEMEISDEHRQPAMLGKLVSGWGLNDMEIGAWLAFKYRFDEPAVDTVLRGVIAALDIDQTELAKDIAWARLHLCEQEFDLLRQLPRLFCEPDWNKAKSIKLPAADLIRALSHPSKAVSVGATHLLEAGIGGETAKNAVKEMLKTTDDFTLTLTAYLVPSMFGDESLHLILDRLETRITPGCEALYKVLPGLLEDEIDYRTYNVLLSGIVSEYGDVAIAAVNVLRKLKLEQIRHLAPELLASLNVITRNGVLCKCCGKRITESICPMCHPTESFGVITANARPDMIRILADIKALDAKDLLALCDDRGHGVADASVEKLIPLLEDRNMLDAAIDGLASGTIGTKALDAVIAVSTESLTQVKNKLLSLFTNSNVTLRVRFLRSLPCAEWISVEESYEIARQAMDDEDAVVRDAAVRVLRTLQ